MATSSSSPSPSSSPPGSGNCFAMTGSSTANDPSEVPSMPYAISVPTLTCCHLQPPAGLLGGWSSHVSLEGFSASQPKAVDDATAGGVPAPLPLASASAGLCSYSQFRLPG